MSGLFFCLFLDEISIKVIINKEKVELLTS